MGIADIFFFSSANSTVWAYRSKAGSSCLRKDGEIKELSQHQAESVPCWSLFGFNVPFVCVCVCVRLSVFLLPRIPLPFPLPLPPCAQLGWKNLISTPPRTSGQQCPPSRDR